MKCPRCNQYMQLEAYQGRMVNQCFHCGGLWFENNTLMNALATDPSGVGKFNRPTNGKIFNAKIVCPQCGIIATQKNYCFDSSIMIDVCQTCHGVFLDGGELQAIYSYLKKNHLMDNLQSDTTPSFVTAIVDFMGKFLKK